MHPFNIRYGTLARSPIRAKPDLADCHFYHAFDLNNGTEVGGPSAHFDLRGVFDDYIGNYDLNGKTVFDFGTASGFLAFSAEQRGATVTAFDTPTVFEQDRVPYRDHLFYTDKCEWLRATNDGFERLHNSFWYMWHEYGTKVAMCYGSLRDLFLINEKFDVVIAGAVIEHLGDPITAIGLFAKLAKEAVILPFTAVLEEDGEFMRPLIPWDKIDYSVTWWGISRGLYARVFGNLGFSFEYVPIQALLVDGPLRTTVSSTTIIACRT